MAVSGTTGCLIDIGTNTTALSSETAWVAIGEVESVGNFADSSEIVRFLSLTDSRVRKAKGTRDAGDVELVVGFDVNDDGQEDLKAAADDNTNNAYNFRIRLNDAPAWAAPNVGSTPTTFTFRALVNGFQMRIGAANGTVLAATTLSITTAVTQTDAAVTPA